MAELPSCADSDILVCLASIQGRTHGNFVTSGIYLAVIQRRYTDLRIAREENCPIAAISIHIELAWIVREEWKSENFNNRLLCDRKCIVTLM